MLQHRAKPKIGLAWGQDRAKSRQHRTKMSNIRMKHLRCKQKGPNPHGRDGAMGPRWPYIFEAFLHSGYHC